MAFRSLLLLLLISSLAYGQSQPEKVFNKQFDKDTYYIRLLPDNAIKGLCVIIPGLFDGPASPLMSKIPEGLVKNGIAIIIPILSKDNGAIKLEDKYLDNLTGMILDAEIKAGLSRDIPIIIGGHSVGGTVALRFYAENQAGRLKHQLNNITNVFATDPPLNMVRLRAVAIKHKEKDVLGAMNAAALNSKLKLQHLSLYYPEMKAALPSFSATKLRIYSEPDINWWIANKGMDLYDLNILDISAYINILHKNPQNKVELVLTENKGYRYIGGGKTERHPHSFSIADPDDLIQWVLASI
jgi:hypothetical protein